MQERNEVQDEAWIRTQCAKYAPKEMVYIKNGYYDGGYEVRVGSYTFFIEYETIDANDEAWLVDMLRKGGMLL